MESNFLNLILLRIGFIVVLLLYIAGLLKVCYCEWRINKLYKDMEKEIKKHVVRIFGTQLHPLYEEKERWTKQEYEVQITELERKRKFLLEKLPFFRK